MLTVINFKTQIKPRDKAKCRKMIKLSGEVKKEFKVNQDVKVIISIPGDPLKHKFVAKIRQTIGSGYFVELPYDIRDYFKMEQEVKVSIESIEF